MGMNLEFIDVRRAYLHVETMRDLFIELPEEYQEEGMCGRLKTSMYGTRDAAQNWEREYESFMRECGFSQGRSSPCVFYHEERSVRIVVHGDDVTALGKTQGLDWFRKDISQRYEVKLRGRLGPNRNDDKSVRILNRIVEWGEDEIRYEADQRHAEIIIKHLGMRENTKGVTTPGIKETEED